MRLWLLVLLPLLFCYASATYEGTESGEPDIESEKRQMRASMVRFGKRLPSDRSSMVRFGKRAPSDRSAMVRFGRAPSDRSAMVRFGKRMDADEAALRYFAQYSPDTEESVPLPAV